MTPLKSYKLYKFYGILCKLYDKLYTSCTSFTLLCIPPLQTPSKPEGSSVAGVRCPSAVVLSCLPRFLFAFSSCMLSASLSESGPFGSLCTVTEASCLSQLLVEVVCRPGLLACRGRACQRGGVYSCNLSICKHLALVDTGVYSCNSWSFESLGCRRLFA